MKRKCWSKEEEKKLIEIFSNLRNSEISVIMNRSVNAIHKKAHTLNLKKSKEHKSETIGTRNKIVRRDLTFNTLKKIASKYKTRGEFQRNDNSAYTTARIQGHLNNICGHMIKVKYSIPQIILSEIVKIIIDKNIIFNDRKKIKPYELDIFVSKYNLAFEYDGKRWHNNNNNDIIKNDLCKERNIRLVRLKENSRNYTKDIKNQLIDNINIINNYCNLNIKEKDIINIDEQKLYDSVNDNIFDEKRIKEIISKYNNYHDFKINENKLYHRLMKTKQLKKYISHLKKNTIDWDINKIYKEISKYEYLCDFYTNSSKCYLYVKRHKLDYILNKLKLKKIIWDIDKIKNIIIKNKIKNISNLKKLYPGCIKFLKRNNQIKNIKIYIKHINTI